MKHLNPFQNFVVRVCQIIPFNVNEALKQQWRDGKQAGLEEGRKEKAVCTVCPLYKADQIRLHMVGAYEPPSPTTDGKIAAAQGARQKHITRQLQEHPGTLMQHDRAMRQHKQRRSDGPWTEVLPNVPRGAYDQLIHGE